MVQIWVSTIASVIIISLISLIGVFTLSIGMDRLRKVLLFMVSFAAGGLLGDAFIHLLPEAIKDTEYNITLMSLLILAGLLSFFILEKILWWRHCHIPTSEDHPHPVASTNLIGDAFHNFIDGTIIAGSFLVSVPLGVTTTIAVILHEIPQEIGDFGILLHTGMKRAKALFYNFLSASVAILGAVVTLLIGRSMESIHTIIVPLTIGGFIYIASADLIPELKKESHTGKSVLQLLSLLFGVGIMALLLLID
ncbi:MAG: ZIP family metal transporter [Patescibacteria group bacterium]|jgi:zinc and cadmium transporter